MATNTMTRLKPSFRPKQTNFGKETTDEHFAIGSRTVQRDGQRWAMQETIYSPMKDYRPVPGATTEHNAVRGGNPARFVALERAAQFISEVCTMQSKTPRGEMLALAHRLGI